METVLIPLLCLLTITLWVWALIKITRSRRLNPIKMTLWLLVVLIFPVIGSILYFQLNEERTVRRRTFRPAFNKHY